MEVYREKENKKRSEERRLKQKKILVFKLEQEDEDFKLKQKNQSVKINQI